MPRFHVWAALAIALFLGAADASAGPRDASSPGAEPRLVRVQLGPSQGIATLLEAGLDVIESHGDRDATILAWPGDDGTLARLGLRTEVLDEHPGRTAARRSKAELEGRPAPVLKRVQSAIRPDGVFRTEGYPPFGSGSMGGFWTTAEIKSKLDDLVASDANDVVANKIDTVGTTHLGPPDLGTPARQDRRWAPIPGRSPSSTRSPTRASRAACRPSSTSSTTCCRATARTRSSRICSTSA